MHKTYFFCLQFPFFIWFIPLEDIIGIKPTPGDHESNLKKVGAIAFGCNTKWTVVYIPWSYELLISLQGFPGLPGLYPQH